MKSFPLLPLLKKNFFFCKKNPSAPTLAQRRFISVMMGCGCAFLLLVFRLWNATVLTAIDQEAATVQKNLKEARADLVDRNGVLLATNVKTFSIYATPHLMFDFREAAQKLSALFPQFSQSALQKRLRSSKRFAWVARHITPEQKEEVLSLGIPGIEFMEDQRRFWPHGSLFSHLLGLTNVDQTGISGLEKGLDPQLRNRETAFVLSVDTRIQHILRDELRQAIEDFQAQAGNALIVKVKTGEIIASVSLPDFNPYAFSETSPQALFNRNTTGVYEFGSLLKIHNTAMVLEKGVANLNSIYDASYPLQVGRFRITDFRGKNRPLTLTEAFLYSSNIASAKMALAAGIESQRAFFKKLGFNQPVNLEIPERACPLLPQSWQESTLITASYGYGIAITPLHMIQSFNTIISGYHRPLTFIKKTTEIPGKRVIKAATAQKIRFLLKEATINGQATKAAVPGYEVGAKTGTCNLRNERGRYLEKQNMTSCVCAFPIDEPEYSILFVLERPQPNKSTHGYATAGWMAAPRVSRIIKRCAPLLGILPQPITEKEGLLPFSGFPSAPAAPLLLTLDSLLTELVP